MKKYDLVSYVILIAAVIIVPVITGASRALAESAYQPSTVVELYSSQGCSSCPPADKFLGELVQNRDILGLTFSVTYWDYIGWKDTFGNKDNDYRQAYYKQEFGSRYVYTPQMIIGGKDHKVGSDQNGVKSLIKENAEHAQFLLLQWNFKGDTLEVDIPSGQGEATIWLVDIDHAKEVNIGRGENTGRTVVYHNVVRKIRSAGVWDGTAKKIKLDLAEMREMGRDGCALIIQKGQYGPIIAALNVML